VTNINYTYADSSLNVDNILEIVDACKDIEVKEIQSVFHKVTQVNTSPSMRKQKAGKIIPMHFYRILI